MKIRCNNCMEVFDENLIVYDKNENMEFCPCCGKSGCLMDLSEDEINEKGWQS